MSEFKTTAKSSSGIVGNVYLEQCGAPANAQCWVDVYDYSSLTGSFGRGKYRGRFACTKVSDGHYKFQLPGNYNVHHNIADYCDAINSVIDKVCGLNAWPAPGSEAKQFMCLQISAALTSGIVSAPVAAGFLVACEGVSTALDAGCALVNGNMDLPEGTPGLGDGLCAVLREIDYFSAEITEAPSFVSIFHEKKIAPNQVGRIIIIIDLSEIKDIWGLQKYHLLIKSEGKRLIIPIEAIFVEKFIKKVDKPRLLVPVSSYTIDTSINSEVKFLYRNIGKDTLHIRNTKRNGPADFISVGSYQIPPESQDYY